MVVGGLSCCLISCDLLFSFRISPPFMWIEAAPSSIAILSMTSPSSVARMMHMTASLSLIINLCPSFSHHRPLPLVVSVSLNLRFQELKCAKEAFSHLEVEEGGEDWNMVRGSRSAAAASDLRQALETAERELVELRAMVARKGGLLLFVRV